MFVVCIQVGWSVCLVVVLVWLGWPIGLAGLVEMEWNGIAICMGIVVGIGIAIRIGIGMGMGIGIGTNQPTKQPNQPTNR